MGIVALDGRADGPPGRYGRLRLELPPVRLYADGVEALDDAGDSRVRQRAVLAGDDLDEKLPTEAARCGVETRELALLLRLERLGIIRVVEAQALDRVGNRPFDEARAKVGATLELQRPRARHLDGPADPEWLVRSAEQRLPPIDPVDEHSKARTARGDTRRGVDGEALEGADPFPRH